MAATTDTSKLVDGMISTQDAIDVRVVRSSEYRDEYNRIRKNETTRRLRVLTRVAAGKSGKKYKYKPDVEDATLDERIDILRYLRSLTDTVTGAFHRLDADELNGLVRGGKRGVLRVVGFPPVILRHAYEYMVRRGMSDGMYDILFGSPPMEFAEGRLFAIPLYRNLRRHVYTDHLRRRYFDAAESELDGGDGRHPFFVVLPTHETAWRMGTRLGYSLPTVRERVPLRSNIYDYLDGADEMATVTGIDLSGDSDTRARVLMRFDTVAWAAT